MPRTTTHVVIAEPDADTRGRLVAVVAQVATALDRDVTVHETTTGTSAFAACSEHKPLLLVTEVLLDGLSGLTLLRRLGVESKAKTAVVFVTDMAREHDRYWALRNWALAYLTKPFDAATLRTKIERVLTQGARAPADAPAQL